MLTLPLLSTAVPDLSNLGQATPAQNAAEGFLALLNIQGNGGNDIWSGNNQSAPGNSGQDTAGQSLTAPAHVPAAVFAANNSSQDNHAPAPPEKPAAQQNSSPANQAQDNTANPSHPAAPTLKPSKPDQGAAASSSSQPASTPTTADQTAGGTDGQASRQLRAQLQNQLGAISDILLSMIQALSGGAMPVQAAAGPATQLVASATANSASDPAQSAGTGAQTAQDQEIALLKDMQSLLQQLQQSLATPGNRSNVQTLSDSLLSDMTRLSQLVHPSATAGSNGNSTDPLLGNAQPFGDPGSLLKNSIEQVKNQLQTLKTNNETIFAQAKASLQTTMANISDSPKTDAGNKDASGVAPPTINIPTAPIVQETPEKPTLVNLAVNAQAVLQTNVPQDSAGNSGNGNNQDQSQNQAPQPVIAAASSSPASSAAGSASFAKILNQVSQGEVLEQVRFQVKTALGDGSSTITIKLSPPELGTVNVKLDVSADGKASGITITADNKNTLDLLQRDTQGLTRALNDAGLTTDSGSLNFSLSGGGQQQGQPSQQAAATYQQAQPEEDNPAIASLSRSYVVNLVEGLDITI